MSRAYRRNQWAGVAAFRVRRILLQWSWILGAFAVLGCPPSPPPPIHINPANLPLIVGMEYAFAGLAEQFSELRAGGVKLMPDAIGWDRMQTSATAAIDFTLFDRMVSEYQATGFEQFMIGLKSKSDWASIAPGPADPSETNYAPKPEYMDDYAAWVQAVVERYDHDGISDMPGLRHAIRYYEVGVEFSTYEPEPVDVYLNMLETAYQAAHAAYPDVVVLNAAFLTTSAFASNPTPDQYEEAFAAVDERIMYHTLDDIRAVLDRPGLFDMVNFHALSNEVVLTVEWLEWEMARRGYEKPIVISDTAVNPLIGWGIANNCAPIFGQAGVLIPPATEADRCRLAEFFTQLIAGDADTLAWARGFAAADMIKLVVDAAGAGVHFINPAYMEELTLLQAPAFGAAAGMTAWDGMGKPAFNAVTQEHSVTTLYPMYYALRQLIWRLDGYDEVTPLETGDPRQKVYQVHEADGTGLSDFWIAWYEPETLVLPGDDMPETTFTFNYGGTRLAIEPLITAQDQVDPETEFVNTPSGIAEIALTSTPAFLFLSPL